ncbi:MAG: glycosyltransferase, partial [Phycisphaerales bacterium]|nr:glycosyltransferase [Phycisphaerales bacterium]
MTRLTAAHVTHEACEKIGGIGSVLEGLITSPVYQHHVKRSILVGPNVHHLEKAPPERLGCDGRVQYSTVDQIDELGLHGKFRPIESAFNVGIVYGQRDFSLPGSEDHTGSAEVLLIDVFNINTQHVNQFKRRLWDVFGIDSTRYESDWAYEEYVRLAEPAFYALLALLKDDELPCLMFSHEFMGLPAAFKATLDGQRQFRTVFHAHECATARRLVEDHAGHDTSFYNILNQASKSPTKLYVDDVFGDQSRLFRHALISKAHVCDAIIAVGEFTAREMHFLGRQFDHHHIDLVHNGIPHLDADLEQVMASRRMLLDYSGRLLGWRPDVLMTHVMRPVISKGVWRDMLVCHELDWRFAQMNRRGALYILTSAGGTRRPQDITSMKAEYGWPRQHREGYPDLVGPEAGFNQMVEQFNATHRNVQGVLVNQFGWSQELCGEDLPVEMTFGDLRRATDVEFGMATYEPFGISPLEPLGSGAVCVISNVCGCRGFVDEVTGGVEIDNVIVGDFTRLDRPWS